MKARKGLNRIVMDEKVMTGKPIIKGTRVTVEAIIGRFAEGLTATEILNEYPKLTEKDIRAALAYAAKLVANEEIIPKAEIYA